MQLWDIYHAEIPDFLVDAARTDAVQRLRYVGMNCGCEYTAFPEFAGIAPYSRFDHSMGVALIVWHFTGNRAQAMSGLLHDIATPVFAHVIDFLHGDHMRQESTEGATAQFIRSSAQIVGVLEKYGLSPEAVDDYHRYPIADNDSPRLSADRLEYTLGNAVNYRILSTGEAAHLYSDLTVGINESGETELVFRHRECALAFGEAALRCSKIYVSDSDRYAMQYLAELLKQAITEGILTETDLYLQEQAVIDKLMASPFCSQWNAFRSLHKTVRSDTPGNSGFWRQIPAKKRYIDPYTQGLGRASALYPAFCEKLKDFRNSSQEVLLCGK